MAFLATLNRHSWSLEQLPVVRAIEVLEHAGTAEASQVLDKLAHNTADAV